jgi:hypothetical protein
MDLWAIEDCSTRFVLFRSSEYLKLHVICFFRKLGKTKTSINCFSRIEEHYM